MQRTFEFFPQPEAPLVRLGQPAKGSSANRASVKFGAGPVHVTANEMRTMSAKQTTEPEYGNWVSTKLIYGSIALSILFFAPSFMSPLFVVGAIPFLLSFAYFAYARYMFSQRGGDLQALIRNLIVERLDWDGEGKALDIPVQMFND